jgi:hypothetical protein
MIANTWPATRAVVAPFFGKKYRNYLPGIESSPALPRIRITASIYQQPHRQGQLAVRLMADNLTSKVPFPPTVHLSPGVAMSSNLHLFREIRLATAKFDDSVLSMPRPAKALKRLEA